MGVQAGQLHRDGFHCGGVVVRELGKGLPAQMKLIQHVESSMSARARGKQPHHSPRGLNQIFFAASCFLPKGFEIIESGCRARARATATSLEKQTRICAEEEE